MEYSDTVETRVRRGMVQIACAALATIGPLATGAAASDKPRNLILITIDTLRADHLSAYGCRRATSPNLDRFMARGARFEWAFSSASYTAPSHITLMTGLYPSFTSVMLDNGRFFKLSGKTITLAELCRDRGMRTAAIVSNPTLNRRLGLHQGFAIYSDLQLDRGRETYVPKNAADTTQEALEVLDLIHDAPFFLWVHYQDPHGPYTPPQTIETFSEPPVAAEQDKTLEVGKDTSGYKAIPTYQVIGDERRASQYTLRYDNEILYLDRQIQALFDRMIELRLVDNTLIVLTSDHGEAFSEDEFYFAHSHSVGLDQVHVPLAMIGAGIKPGTVLKTPVAAVDVYATMHEALDLPSVTRTPGQSLLEAVRQGREPAERKVFVESFSQRGIVMNGLFYREDRRPPDSPIWKISPTTNGTHVPLGAQLVRLRDQRVLNPREGAVLAAELTAFSLQAEQAIRETFDELVRRPKADRTVAENNGLVFFRDELGYDFDLVDLEPVAPENLSPEEKAQRRATASLGYLDQEKDVPATKNSKKNTPDSSDQNKPKP